eukprot:COSAG01_NODE_7756_length_3068_cov_8.251263_1_plen_38_part_00
MHGTVTAFNILMMRTLDWTGIYIHFAIPVLIPMTWNR